MLFNNQSTVTVDKPRQQNQCSEVSTMALAISFISSPLVSYSNDVVSVVVGIR
jgi:hypothetical protein